MKMCSHELARSEQGDPLERLLRGLERRYEKLSAVGARTLCGAPGKRAGCCRDPCAVPCSVEVNVATALQRAAKLQGHSHQLRRGLEQLGLRAKAFAGSVAVSEPCFVRLGAFGGPGSSCHSANPSV